MAKRQVVCPCGHPMTASGDEELFPVVRRHTDDDHPEKRYTNEFLKQYIRENAQTVP